jgi:mono/diheme cytochrome c family protein
MAYLTEIGHFYFALTALISLDTGLEPLIVFVYAASATPKGNGASLICANREDSFEDGMVNRTKLLVHCFFVSCSIAALTRSVWDGVYTKQQANRGQSTYQEECLKCHGENLGGGEAGPPLAGEGFLRKWKGKSVGDLSEAISKTMPSDDPGNLSSREYSDIVAYILSANEFPAGQKELDRDLAALKEIQIDMKR